MKIAPVTFKLTENDIKRYRRKIVEFPVEREKEILDAIPAKVKTIVTENTSLPSFIADLIEDVRTIFEALIGNNSFTGDTKKKALFALNYFLDEDDDIPDNIHIFGFLDDAVVVRWVLDEIIKDSARVPMDTEGFA